MEKKIKTSKEITATLAKLPSLSVKELHVLHAELFGKEVKSRNKPFLQRKLTKHLQEMKKTAQENGQVTTKKTKKSVKRSPPRKTARRSTKSSERGKARKSTSPKDTGNEKSSVSKRDPRRERDSRLPAPGAVLSRTYKGTLHEVTVKDEGFEYNGEPYRSLSRIATDIAGSNWNGFRFFKDSLAQSGGGFPMKEQDYNPFLAMAESFSEHPVDRAVDERFGEEALKGGIHLVADTIAQRLGRRRRKLGRLMGLMDKYHRLKGQAYFNVGYEHGLVDGGIKTFVETNQVQRGAEYRRLAKKVGQLAAQHLLPEHLRAAALLEAAWCIIAGKRE